VAEFKDDRLESLRVRLESVHLGQDEKIMQSDGYKFVLTASSDWNHR